MMRARWLYKFLVIYVMAGIHWEVLHAQALQEIEALIYKSDSLLYDAPDQSLEYSQRAIEISLEINNDSALAEARFRKGSAFWSKGDLSDALYELEKAIVLVEEHNNPLLLALINKRIGTLYSAIGDETTTIFYTKKSLRYYQMIRDKNGIAGVYNNIGRAFRGLSQYDSATYYLNKGLVLLEGAMNPTTCMLNYNLGRSYIQLERHDLAIKHLETALAQSEALNHNQGIIRTKSVLSKLLLELGERNRAQQLAVGVRDLANRLNSKDVHSLIYGIQSEISFATGDFLNAYKNLELSNTYRDSILSEENKSRLKFYQIKRTRQELEFFKKENTIRNLEAINSRNSAVAIGIIAVLSMILAAIFYHIRKVSTKASEALEEKNWEINLQRNELKELSDFKTRLIAIVSHDLRSPVQGLMGVLDLMEKGLIDPKDVGQVIPDLQLRLKRNYDKIDDLLNWSSQGIGNSEENNLAFSLNQCMHNVIDDLSPEAEGKGIDLHYKYEQDIELKSNEKILRTVVRNVVLNAIKFSKPDNQVLIRTSLKDDCALISIKDWGVGMTAQKTKELFRKKKDPTSGTKNELGSGLGLIICKDLLHFIKGKIWVESEADQGSEFFVSIPRSL